MRHEAAARVHTVPNDSSRERSQRDTDGSAQTILGRVMRGRLDSEIYQEALLELCRRHATEFAAIRREMLGRAQIDLRTPDPDGGKVKCLLFLADHLDSTGKGPSSFSEIGAALVQSWNCATQYCNELEADA
jgi:hypothetical protein